MGLLDFFKKKPSAVVAEEQVQVTEPELDDDIFDTMEPFERPAVSRDRVVLTEQEIVAIVSDYVDSRGVKGFSIEETPMIRRFYFELFIYFHHNGLGRNVANCSLNDHSLSASEPIFMTGSGKVFCQSCALDYVIGFGSNWHYYLGDISAGLGPVPDSIQKMGKALQAKISQQKETTKGSELERIAKSADQNELFQIVMTPEKDFDTRVYAMDHLTDISLLARVADAPISPRFRFEALKHDLPESLLEKLALADDIYQVRETAVRKMKNQTLLEHIALTDAKRDLRNVAVKRLVNPTALKQIVENDGIEYVRMSAQKRLAELEK